MVVTMAMVTTLMTILILYARPCNTHFLCHVCLCSYLKDVGIHHPLVPSLGD
jgi:hypothetical protein